MYSYIIYFAKNLLDACVLSDWTGDVILELFIIEDDTVRKAEGTDSIAVDLANGWNNMIWRDGFTTLCFIEVVMYYSTGNFYIFLIKSMTKRSSQIKIDSIDKILFIVLDGSVIFVELR